ncbi:unnamed protein product [Ranitomeya imitator]|uniref:Reverse transcriptase domain-containing protein n=1 Tax=Ranitomeya imitator TaxID=111125 RepID=A0ABN9MJV7_9NEOB|nr:unnamed protein product [Ranitomeya imitator]
MNRTDYVQEIHHQLRDDTVYQKLPRDPTLSLKDSISNVLSEYHVKGIIDIRTKEYLTKNHPITPVFYTPPKIHKTLEHPPGRPIKTPSFLLDTGDFLRGIRELSPVPKNSILLTLDVKDLHTSIPHAQGIECVRHMLMSTEMDPEKIQFCLERLTLVLTKNYSVFEDSFYLQIKGTAMGSNLAPPYVNCFMAHFGDTVVYNDPLFKENVITWKRFIDDIFCVWGGSPESLDTFLLTINSSWQVLHFTMTRDFNQVNFMDNDKRKFGLEALASSLTFSHRMIRRHWDLLRTARPDIPEFQQQPILPCFRRTPNIRDSLIRADIGTTRATLTQ